MPKQFSSARIIIFIFILIYILDQHKFFKKDFLDHARYIIVGVEYLGIF